MKDKVKIIVTAIVGSLVLAGVLAILASSPGLALQEESQSDGTGYQRIVNVSGSGQIDARPDVVVVTVGVQTEAEEAAVALTENSQQMQALLDVLSEAGLAAEDIQTQVVNLHPRYSTEPTGAGEQQLVGYTASNVVEVRMRDLEAVGGILDAAVQAGGNRIDGIRFEVSDPGAFLDQAREAAWNDAQHKAEQLADLAGAQLGSVLTINESNRGLQPVIERPVAIKAAAAVPVEAGSQTIEVDLQVAWSLGEAE
jgi:uncharacterized protein YggE